MYIRLIDFIAAGFGFAFGALAMFLMRQYGSNLDPLFFSVIVTLISIVALTMSLIVPMFPPLYKFMAPGSMPLVWSCLWGMAGFLIGWVTMMMMILAGDARRFNWMDQRIVSYSIRVTSVRTIVICELCAMILAGLGCLVILGLLYGMSWDCPGEGMLGKLLTEFPRRSAVLYAGLFGSLVGFTRQNLESFVAHIVASKGARY